MAETNTMKNVNIVIFITLIILFILGIIIYKYFYDQHINYLTEITYTNEFHFPIESVKLDHGVIFINNEYYISHRIENTSNEIYSLKDLAENSQLTKRQNSDSIFISSDGQPYLILFLKKD